MYSKIATIEVYLLNLVSDSNSNCTRYVLMSRSSLPASRIPYLFIDTFVFIFSRQSLYRLCLGINLKKIKNLRRKM